MALKIKDQKNALNWTAPPNPVSLLADKIVHYVTGAGIRFLPYVEVDAAETVEMRRNYRTMWREPSIAAALDSMIFGTMSLDWNVLPADASEPMDRRNADWLRWNFEEPGILRGGVRNLISSILVGALIEGISVSQKVFEPTECRKWGMKLPLTELRPIDPDDYELQEDHNRKITAVLSRIGYRRYEPDNFVIWSYMPLYGSARGHAILRRVTREFWIIDTAMKFHRVGLERFVLPWFKALGPADQHDALEKASRQLGALGYFIGTSDMTVEAMQLSLEGEKFENAIRLYMNRIMLGLTGAFLQATEGQVTGARSIGEVHQQSAELGAWYRQSGVEQAINEHLVPQIVRFNFADGGLPKIKLGGVNDEWQAKRLVIFQGAWNMGLRISAKQVQDELGLQAPMDASDELKQQPALGGGLGLPGFSDQAAASDVRQDGVASAPSRNPLAVGAAALQQSTNYTCGPIALLMALAYFGKDEGETEQTLAAEMGTTPENGTAPEAIAQAARVRGLNVATRQQMSMEALEAETVQGKLVICPIQAHGTTGEMQQLQAGHYVVVSRSEEDIIQFLDPSVPGGVAMDKDDFAACWIDQESDGGLYVRYGIILSIGSDELQCQDGPNKGKPGPCPKGTDSEKPSKPGEVKIEGAHSKPPPTLADAITSAEKDLTFDPKRASKESVVGSKKKIDLQTSLYLANKFDKDGQFYVLDTDPKSKTYLKYHKVTPEENAAMKERATASARQFQESLYKEKTKYDAQAKDLAHTIASETGLDVRVDFPDDSNSRYVFAKMPKGGEFKIRIADHPQPVDWVTRDGVTKREIVGGYDKKQRRRHTPSDYSIDPNTNGTVEGAIAALKKQLKETGAGKEHFGDEPNDFEPVPIAETKAGKVQTDNTALAGPDGRAIAELMAYTIKRGTEVLSHVTEEAVKRLLGRPSPGRVQRLFNEDERKEITDSLAMTLAPADLLGRSRMRLWFDQAEERAEKKRIKHYADVPTDMAVFVDTLQPLPPLKALEYFRALVPTIGVDPETFVNSMGQRAFTLCVATDQLLLDRVKQAIQETLEYGTASGPQRIQAILDQAGVSQRNPAYAENVYRTNLKTAYNEGADAERQDPDIAGYIPCWRFVGIRDGRQRMRHEIHFDKFYPNSVTFAVIRDSAAGKFDGFNCRCDQIPIHRVEWERLENAGARIEQTW